MKLPHITNTSDMTKPLKRVNAFWLTAAVVVAISLLMLWRKRHR